MANQKQRMGEVVTLKGAVVNNAALDRNGIPQLGAKLGFITIGKSGSVKDRSISKDAYEQKQAVQ